MTWTVLRPAPSQRNGRHVIARCDCGAEVDVLARDIETGHSKRCRSCGSATHALTHSPTYESWHHMMQRTGNPKNSHYAYYGGRGVTVCERWQTFDGFLADMGMRPKGTTLDRFPNNDGNYEPGNVRWATRSEQQRNTRMTRLSPDVVNEIRGRAEHGEGVRSIARRFEMNSGRVSEIVRNLSWRDV